MLRVTRSAANPFQLKRMREADLNFPADLELPPSPSLLPKMNMRTNTTMSSKTPEKLALKRQLSKLWTYPNLPVYHWFLSDCQQYKSHNHPFLPTKKVHPRPAPTIEVLQVPHTAKKPATKTETMHFTSGWSTVIHKIVCFCRRFSDTAQQMKSKS